MLKNDHIILIQVGNESLLRKSTKNHDMPPIGLLYIASMLRVHGYDVSIVDLMTSDYSSEALENELRKHSVAPLMIGLSVYTEMADAALEIARFIRGIYPETTIVAGGPHATFCEEEILACPAVDYVVRGEGESTVIELLEAIKNPALPRESIPGISFRAQDGSINRTAQRDRITLLDILPLPAYDLYDLDAQRKVFSVVSSRGCPGHCIFCSSGAYSGSMYRMHSAEWLFSLIFYHYQERRFRYIDLLDDTFTVNWRRTKRFCELLKSSGAPFVMLVRSRVDLIREEVIRTLSEAGCKAIHIGVESADQGVLDAIAKGVTLEQIFSAIELMVQYGIHVKASFMIGHPADSLASIEKTLILASVVNDLGLSAVAIATPFPGTQLHRESERLGMKIAVKNWRKYDTATPIFSTAAFDLNQLRQAYFTYISYRGNIRGRKLLTDDPHTEFWKFLDEWKAKLKPRAALKELPAAAAS